MNGNVPARRSTDIPQKRVRRGMYILPSLFTSGNIAAGFYAILQTMRGSALDYSHYDYAAIAIGFAILFDGLDGRIARMTNTVSDFGRELDSLADVITFGVAPALLAYTWGFSQIAANANGQDMLMRVVHVGGIVSFLFLVSGASRLARFNISKNPQPKNPGRPGRKYFVGMPIPAGAGIVAAAVHFSPYPLETWWVALLWAALVMFVGFLMVCTWRFYSGKDLDLGQRQPFYALIAIGGLIALIRFFSQEVLLSLALGYMFSGIFFRVTYAMRRRPPQAMATE
ncbi:MAG TPA: CDP-diacylglycerol--serine O-phosphatidyltransferase [Terriglobales bacterium]|jgi:CDP-diacylglycerol--serine O-phosphatidyltransferase